MTNTISINDRLGPGGLENVGIFSTDANGNTALVGGDGTRHSTLGTSIITAGTGGRYATLQAAVDAALAESQFTENALTGTATFTLGSRVVTGVSTSFTTELLYATHISVTTGGIRKWYPLDGSVISDTVVVLAVPFMDTTAVGVGIVSGVPNRQRIMLLSDNTSAVNLGDASANLVGCLNIDFNGFASTKVLRGKLTSGEINIANSPHFSFLAGTTPFIGDYRLDNLQRQRADAGSQQDWLGLGGAANYSGRVYGNNLRCTGNFDIFLPNVIGHAELSNSHLRSLPDYAGNASTTNQPVNGLFAANGATAIFQSVFLEAACYGSATSNVISIDGADQVGALTTGNKVTLKDCTGILYKAVGSTENTISRGMYLSIDDCDIYLENSIFRTDGSPTAGTAWRMWASDPGVTTPSRIHSTNSTLLDLRSVTTNAVITTLRGDRGVKALTVAATLDANELSALRGQLFTVTLGATLITSIPSVSNAPEGTEIHFVFTQDGTGGHNVSGWNAAYKFHTAWSDTGNTANKQSTVSFRKAGSSWVQTGAANSWV